MPAIHPSSVAFLKGLQTACKEANIDGSYDYSTYANYLQYHVTHYQFDQTFDFANNIVYGTCSCTVLPGAGSLPASVCADLWGPGNFVLDSMHIDVEEVLINGNKAEFGPFTEEHHDVFGNGVVITIADIPKNEQGTWNVVIRYRTRSDTPALCWLGPEQTFGQLQPYVFSQGQSILNRGYFPCQDTPAVKATYNAHITVPKPLTAVMSAEKQGLASTQPTDATQQTFSFAMPQPIPIYLAAIAVGDITSKSIGPRSRVWTEPSFIDKAAAEFEGVTEKYIKTGERLFGPYLWDEYDILIMPPAFPWGGMENPRLTFVTPTLIAGDRSLTSVLAHEISHSWFGNLVTNGNWSEFWLNEGFTTYAERRLMTECHGRDLSDMEAVLGARLLREEEGNVADKELTKLRPEVIGMDPDETYNEFPYEKGFAFLKYLCSLVGDESKFDAFLCSWVTTYKFKSVTSADFLAFLSNAFPDLPHAEFDQWLNQPGLPPYDIAAVVTNNAELKKAQDMARRWQEDDISSLTGDKISVDSWHTNSKLVFLDTLIDEASKLTLDRLQALVKTYGFGHGHNAEITLRWCKLVIETSLESEYDNVREYLTAQGKQKFQLPLYKAMVRSQDTKVHQFARDVYAATSSRLHVSLRKYIEATLAKLP